MFPADRSDGMLQTAIHAHPESDPATLPSTAICQCSGDWHTPVTLQSRVLPHFELSVQKKKIIVSPRGIGELGGGGGRGSLSRYTRVSSLPLSSLVTERSMTGTCSLLAFLSLSRESSCFCLYSLACPLHLCNPQHIKSLPTHHNDHRHKINQVH